MVHSVNYEINACHNNDLTTRDLSIQYRRDSEIDIKHNCEFFVLEEHVPSDSMQKYCGTIRSSIKVKECMCKTKICQNILHKTK